MYPEFYSGDMIGAVSLVTDSVPEGRTLNLWPRSHAIGSTAGNPLLVLGYQYSPVTAGMMLVNVLLWSWLGMAITETVWLLPILAAGAGTVVLAYFLGRELAGARAGLLGTAFLLFLPIHVWQSRYATAGDTVGFFVQGLTLYALLRYLSEGRRVWALMTGLLLGACFYANLLWTGMIPVLAYAVFVGQGGKGLRERARGVISSACRWEILLPLCLAFLGLLMTSLIIGRYQGRMFGGPLGHLVIKMGMSEWGFYLPFYARHIASEAGPVLAGLVPLFLLLGILDIVRLQPRSVLWFWSVCFTLPYWILVGPRTTDPVNYYAPGLQALALYAATRVSGWMDSMSRLRRGLAWTTATLITASSAYATLVTTYHLDIWNGFGLNGHQGVYVPSQGFKAAGYWLRQNTPAHTRVAAFDYGGVGLEPNVGYYYFDRPVLGQYDAPDFAGMLDYFRKEAVRSDYLVIRPGDYQRFAPTDRAFFPYRLAEVRSQEGRTLLQIYGRHGSGGPAVLDDEQAARQFDAAFGHLSSLRGERKLAAWLKGFPSGS